MPNASPCKVIWTQMCSPDLYTEQSKEEVGKHRAWASLHGLQQNEACKLAMSGLLMMPKAYTSPGLVKRLSVKVSGAVYMMVPT